MKNDPAKDLEVYYTDEKHEEIVLVKDISFFLYANTSASFFRQVSIAYIPRKEKLIGISKIARIVDVFSRRLQLQERITKQLADTIMKKVAPYGVIVVIEAEHLCMTMRGVKNRVQDNYIGYKRYFFKDAKGAPKQFPL